jgi:hypothetical protein
VQTCKRALHCTALHCTALHCTALHCTALHCTARRAAAGSHGRHNRVAGQHAKTLRSGRDDDDDATTTTTPLPPTTTRKALYCAQHVRTNATVDTRTVRSQMVHVVSMLDVPIIVGSVSFQSNDVSGAQYSLLLFCIATQNTKQAPREGERARRKRDTRVTGRRRAAPCAQQTPAARTLFSSASSLTSPSS